MFVQYSSLKFDEFVLLHASTAADLVGRRSIFGLSGQLAFLTMAKIWRFWGTVCPR